MVVRPTQLAQNFSQSFARFTERSLPNGGYSSPGKISSLTDPGNSAGQSFQREP
jgi:hypothetical protein